MRRLEAVFTRFLGKPTNAGFEIGGDVLKSGEIKRFAGFEFVKHKRAGGQAFTRPAPMSACLIVSSRSCTTPAPTAAASSRPLGLRAGYGFLHRDETYPPCFCGCIPCVLSRQSDGCDVLVLIVQL